MRAPGFDRIGPAAQSARTRLPVARLRRVRRPCRGWKHGQCRTVCEGTTRPAAA